MLHTMYNTKLELFGHFTRMNESKWQKMINYITKIEGVTKWIEETRKDMEEVRSIQQSSEIKSCFELRLKNSRKTK